MDEAPSPDRDHVENALACLSWSAMYQQRAWEHMSKAAKSLDRKAQNRRNVANYRAQKQTRPPADTSERLAG